MRPREWWRASKRAWLAARAAFTGRPRGKRVFHSAGVNRLNHDLFSSNTSGRQEVIQDLKVLRNRSRTLFRDNPLAKRYGWMFAENVSGHQGFLLTPRALSGDENDRALNAKIADAWTIQCEPTNCTLDGRLGWADLLQYLDRIEPMDGEILLRLYPGAPDTACRFAVQVLDPDQLDVDYRVQRTANGNEIVQGVELNPYGRPVAYWIWDRHPRDPLRGERKRVPAEFIIHDFIPFRPGAARGIPWLHAAIECAHMLGGYAEAELVIARLAAAKGGYWKPTAEDDGEDEETDPELPSEAQPGLFDVAPPGWEFASYGDEHPNSQFGPFQKIVTRWIAAAGNVAYSSLSGDLEAVNFSSIRAGLLSERDFYRMRHQRRIAAICQRVYRAWLPMAQLSGVLPISATDLKRAERVQWRARGFPWVDPEKDIRAAAMEVSMATLSRTQIAAERGRDFEEVLEQIADEIALAKEYDVPIVFDNGISTVLPTSSETAPESTAGGGGSLNGDSNDSNSDARKRLRLTRARA